MSSITSSNIYTINLPSFEGPIELLYQLIQKNKLDITQISLASITDEYLQYIKDHQQEYRSTLNSFLEIASHLIYLKSQSLLPRPIIEEDEEESTFTDILLDRLGFFARLKTGIDFLEASFKPWNYNRARSSYSTLVRGEYSLAPMDLYGFVELTLPWLAPKTKHSLSKGEIKPLYLGVEERWQWILEQINLLDSNNSFFKLVEALPKVDQIISFLTLLEKVKQSLLLAQQEDLFTDIVLEVKNG